MAEKVAEAVKEGHMRCQQLEWDMEKDGAGEEWMDEREVLQIKQTLKCAYKVFTELNTMPENEEVKPHVARMREEKKQLNERIVKLEAFIHENPVYNDLSVYKKCLMDEQLRTMKLYYYFLSERLALEEKEE